jgi:hypothetical protein
MIILLGLWLTLLVSKGTPTGNWLHRVLVVAPAAWLSRWTRGQVILLGGLIGLMLLVMLTFGHDGAALAGLSLADALPAIASIEITAYLDTLVTVVAAASVLRAGHAVRWLRVRLAHRRNARRAPRTARRQRPTRANDDSEGPARLAA